MFLIAVLISGGKSLEARRFEAALPEIGRAGFYRVQLSPHVAAVSGAGFSSLRLRNEAGQEQPYLVQKFTAKAAATLHLQPDNERIPVAEFKQVDSSDKRTYISVGLEESFYVDELRLRFSGPRFYSRIVRMPQSLPDWEQRFNQERELVIRKSIRGRELMLVVDNDDNPPLRLQNITISQHSQYLTAWLERGTYVLEYGDFAAIAPRYDITVLRDTLSEVALPVLRAGPPELVSARAVAVVRPDENPAKPEPAEVAPRPILMWSIIAAILVALVFATRALARRIGTGGDDAGDVDALGG